jgi:hypothetical protein
MLTVIKIDEIENIWLSRTQNSDPNLLYLLAITLRVKATEAFKDVKFEPPLFLSKQKQKDIEYYEWQKTSSLFGGRLARKPLCHRVFLSLSLYFSTLVYFIIVARLPLFYPRASLLNP